VASSGGMGYAFGTRPEIPQKGDLCALEGKVQYRSYQDAQGVTQYRTEIVGKDLQFLSPVSGAEIPNEAK